MKKIRKTLISIAAVILLLVGVSFTYLQMNHHEATPTAVKIAEKNGVAQKEALVFDSQGTHKGSVIFYPGAFVPAESYSIWASDLAKNGYTVYIAEMPFNFAIFAPNQGAKIIANLPKNEKIYLGGHSLGGVMASRFVASHEKIQGIFFLGSYPDKKGSLRDKNISVLSITATEDKVLNQTKYREAKQYLPAKTTFITIEGGNHAGFGSYGKQKKDGTAKITNEVQQSIIGKSLINWLNQ